MRATAWTDVEQTAVCVWQAGGGPNARHLQAATVEFLHVTAWFGLQLSDTTVT